MSPEFVVKVNKRTKRPEIKTILLPGEKKDEKFLRFREMANTAAKHLRGDNFPDAYGELSQILPSNIAGALCIAFNEGEDGSCVQFRVEEVVIERVNIHLPDKTIK